METPLSAAEIQTIDKNRSIAERLWMYVPILGWAIAAFMWSNRTRPIQDRIEAQLKSRPKPEASIWGHDAQRTEFATWLCALIADEMSWPNDHFVPGDPIAVLLWAHNDGLDVESLVMFIEEELGRSVSESEIRGWFKLTLNELVDVLMADRPKQSKQD